MANTIGLQYGIEIVEGMPGSGKSYYAVRRMLAAIEHVRRPVYTNLPLRWRVIRQYLRNRGGSNLANLIHELSEEHMKRFANRASLRGKFHDKARRMRPSAEGKEPYGVVDSRFVAEFGPDITEGPEANWIPSTALIIIDEAHRWFPMREQAREAQTCPGLLDWLSMHRHGLYWVWCITQDRSNVSNSFRKLAGIIVQVRNLSEDCILWGLRFKHIGLRPQGYAFYTRETIDSKSAQKEPFRQEVVISALPSNRWIYRLYDSFSQVASVAEISRALRESREAAGLSSEGEDEHVRVSIESNSQSGGHMSSRFRRVGKLAVLGAALFLAVGVAFLVGRSVVGGGGGKPSASASASAVAAAPVAERKWPKWSGVVADGVVLDGRRVPFQSVGPSGIVPVIVRDGVLVVVVDGDVWLWDRRQPEPKRVGPLPLVASLVQSRAELAEKSVRSYR